MKLINHVLKLDSFTDDFGVNITIGNIPVMHIDKTDGTVHMWEIKPKDVIFLSDKGISLNSNNFDETVIDSTLLSNSHHNHLEISNEIH